jgi:hypothetical protein
LPAGAISTQNPPIIPPTPSPAAAGNPARIFLKALVTPSWGSVFGTLLVAAALLAACVFLVTPQRLARVDVGYLLEDARDDFAFISWRAFQIVEAGPQPAAVALLGASSMLHGITSDADVARVIAQRTDRRMPVYDLTAGGLSPWEAAALMDRIGADFNGVIVLGIGAELLATPPSELEGLRRHPRLAFRTSAFDEELKIAGMEPLPATGNYFIDNSQFFTARIGAIGRLVTGPIRHSRHTDWRKSLDARTWRFQVDRVSQWIRDGYPAHAQANLEVLGRLMARARARGNVRVALLVTPINPRALAEFDPGVDARFMADARAFAAATGAELWRLDDEAALREEEFDDWCHLGNNDGRVRYTRALAHRIASLGDFSQAPENSP